ncbi:MAG: alpha-galactosidase [Bacilli bacterium]|nr:alpha-galactosidase [Bacilli bacterium]
MIEYNEKQKFFHFQTDNSSYIINIYPSGHLGHAYFGAKLDNLDSLASLVLKFGTEVGNQVIYDQEDRTFNLNLALLEVSTYGKGDYRDPMLHFRLQDGSRLVDLHFKNHEVLSNKQSFPEMPESFANDKDKPDNLKITLADPIAKIEVDLYYSVYPRLDVITRRAVIRNVGTADLTIEKALSFGLDMLNDDYELISLDGAWIRERQINVHKLGPGILKIDSKKGVSSNDHNPFIAIKKSSTDETVGKCYGFGLIYSGNFEATAEISPHNLLRVMMGINSFDFYWTLKPNTEFVTPEAIITYSGNGLSKLSQNLHELIKKHIIKPDWQGKERPVLVNNWEATFFEFNERKLLRLARSAQKLGVELFVLDDGWFGDRSDDTKALGDWYVNKNKLPSGLSGFVKKLKRIGLDFGIWVEPEMVNPDSDLYRLHPNWAIKHPKYKPSMGRNQLILDLTNPEVRDYLLQTLSGLFNQANITYCKWDMNRNFSDVYSSYLPEAEQGTFFHRYTVGLYDILNRLTKAFPKILFEGCASGGNRFDAGILYYMPQIWTSDNTDGHERIKIQYGTSMAYPQSTMGAHVSNIPNMQTLRQTSIETRFNTAAFGLLGYELDLSRITPAEKKIIKGQIAFYKEHRKLLQFGRLYRLKSPYEENVSVQILTSTNKDEAMMLVHQTLAIPNDRYETFPVAGIDQDRKYRVSLRKQYFNLAMFGDLVRHALPIKLNANGILFNLLKNRYLMPMESEEQTVSGSLLINSGFTPKQNFIGSGYNEQVRLMGDFGSRIYYFKALGGN